MSSLNPIDDCIICPCPLKVRWLETSIRPRTMDAGSTPVDVGTSDYLLDGLARMMSTIYYVFHSLRSPNGAWGIRSRRQTIPNHSSCHCIHPYSSHWTYCLTEMWDKCPFHCKKPWRQRKGLSKAEMYHLRVINFAGPTLSLYRDTDCLHLECYAEVKIWPDCSYKNLPGLHVCLSRSSILLSPNSQAAESQNVRVQEWLY